MIEVELIRDDDKILSILKSYIYRLDENGFLYDNDRTYLCILSPFLLKKLIVELKENFPRSDVQEWFMSTKDNLIIGQFQIIEDQDSESKFLKIIDSNKQFKKTFKLPLY